MVRFLIVWNANHCQSGKLLSVAELEKHSKGELLMKKLTLSFWLALAAAGIFVMEAAGPSTQTHFGDPIPTCPPFCSAR